MIRESKVHQMDTVIQTSSGEGMITMAKAPSWASASRGEIRGGDSPSFLHQPRADAEAAADVTPN